MLKKSNLKFKKKSIKPAVKICYLNHVFKTNIIEKIDCPLKILHRHIQIQLLLGITNYVETKTNKIKIIFNLLLTVLLLCVLFLPGSPKISNLWLFWRRHWHSFREGSILHFSTLALSVFEEAHYFQSETLPYGY